MCEIKKTFSIHTDCCPDNCTYGWTINDLINTYGVDINVIDKMEKWDIYYINDDLFLTIE